MNTLLVYLIVAAGALLAAAGWYVSLLLWPIGPCWRCTSDRRSAARGGKGRNRGSNSRRWGRCRKCGGTGTRIRFGARAAARSRGRKL